MFYRRNFVIVWQPQSYEIYERTKGMLNTEYTAQLTYDCPTSLPIIGRLGKFYLELLYATVGNPVGNSHHCMLLGRINS